MMEIKAIDKNISTNNGNKVSQVDNNTPTNINTNYDLNPDDTNDFAELATIRSSIHTKTSFVVEEVKFHLSLLTFVILAYHTRYWIGKLSASYSPSYVSSGTILWSNIPACFLMGICQIIHIGELHIPVTIGYCGTLSSYSAIINELFDHSTSTTYYPNRAYGIMEFLSVIVVELTSSMGSLLIGTRFAEEYLTSKKMVSFLNKYVYPITYIFGIPITIVMIVLSGVYSNFSREFLVGSLFSIFGVYLRFYLSKINPKFTIPWGTFIANQVASLIVAVLDLVLTSRKNIVQSKNGRRVLKGLSSGFCSGLSTMSTFMAEGRKIKLKFVLIYYFITIFTSYSIFIIILGSYKWTVGLN
ncbi:uncharacterized protein SCODWIG_02711 [Saccharomycodes ludwigii]|uniref:Uncharacterized protein n=1 Tax=Saccharomycodes ludwigii TaxID=36035 RepID=A0A376B9Z7_9ASCO|nr:hypothetical protein SCDLUD_003627 [Saccharomycodes ludwigii]KAH3900633.1 hypothetical protein SCDLUD_003627 [Saccharomycodes ludwigii]SSD60950.1 uncharacterized protein SCODWIG_02711 [Saccharomycodes ludwigii]